MGYDKSVDRIRGFLVLLMVYAHVLQFFGNGGAFPAVPTLIETINVLVFPTFVFCFGRTSAAAYLHRPFRQAAPRVLKSAVMLYGVFVLSGLGFKLLFEGAPFNTLTVERVMLLRDIPGWSEFLAAFAAYALAVLALLWPLKWLSTRLVPTLVACAGCLALCFLPYERITSPVAGLFIGTRSFFCFPVVQYAPYFLAGAYWQSTKKHGLALSFIGLGASAAGILHLLLAGLPQRFPPSLFWVVLAGFFPAVTSFLASRMEKTPRLLSPIEQWLRDTGRKSLFYLLASNLTLFALAGLKAAPMVTKRDIWFWKQPIASPFGALLWTAALFVAMGLAASLAGRSSPKQPGQPKKNAAPAAP